MIITATAYSINTKSSHMLHHVASCCIMLHSLGKSSWRYQPAAFRWRSATSPAGHWRWCTSPAKWIATSYIITASQSQVHLNAENPQPSCLSAQNIWETWRPTWRYKMLPIASQFVTFKSRFQWNSYNIWSWSASILSLSSSPWPQRIDSKLSKVNFRQLKDAKSFWWP